MNRRFLFASIPAVPSPSRAFRGAANNQRPFRRSRSEQTVHSASLLLKRNSVTAFRACVFIPTPVKIVFAFLTPTYWLYLGPAITYGRGRPIR